MAKPEWGTKRTCPSCGERFYDLLREQIECPECGARLDVDDRGRMSAAKPEKRQRAAVAEDVDLVDDEDLAVDESEETVDDPLLEDEEDEGDEAAGPALSDEDAEGKEPAAFGQDVLLGDDADDDDDEGEGSDDASDLDDDDLKGARARDRND